MALPSPMDHGQSLVANVAPRAAVIPAKAGIHSVFHRLQRQNGFPLSRE
jgi:hypothetical protein